MFKPSRYIRICSLMITLATLAGCADEWLACRPRGVSRLSLSVSATEGTAEEGTSAEATGAQTPRWSEDFDFWDSLRLDSPAITFSALACLIVKTLATRAASSSSRFPPGVMAAPRSDPPRVSNFAMLRCVFARRGRQDQSPRSSYMSWFRKATARFDIEVFNDGSRQILFTTWVDGMQKNSVQHTLPFDPAVRFHNYRIEWSSSRVRFLVDGVLMHEWTGDVPQDAMYVMSNAWWPEWIDGPILDESRMHQIDRIIY